MGLIAELKRRKVFKVGGAYLVVAWLVVQGASIGFPAFDAPPWALRVFILVAFLGFPVALVFAWVFDATPEGIKPDVTRGGIGIYLLAAGFAALALGWYFVGQPSYRAGDIPASPDRLSVAVLPFANMSGNPDEEYFSDGMTEELLNVLARIPKLNVVARTSVFEFKGKGGDVREIGRKLGVSHIVEGSIRRDAGQVRVTAQLIRVADGFHLWSENYDRELKGVFALQDEIARQIGEQLQVKLGVGSMPEARAAIDPVAYDEYLKGRALHRQRRNLPEAVAHLERAVALAPDYGAGWASVALVHEVAYWATTEAERARIGDSFERMIAAAARATALEPRAAMTLHARANVARSQGKYAEAERLYLEGIAADASYPDVREDYAELLLTTGYYRESEKVGRELVELDPRVAAFWTRLLYVGIATGRAELVDEASSRMRELDPGYRFGQIAGVVLALSQGRMDAARTEMAAAQQRAPTLTANDALLFRWAMRDPSVDDAEARRLVREQLLRSSYAAVRGDLDLLLASFANPAARTASYGVYNELSFPVARAWLSDPRVKAVIERNGYPAYWREKGWPELCRPLGPDDFECGPTVAKD